MDALINIASAIAGLVTTFYGYRAVAKIMRSELQELEHKMRSALENKIGVDEYRAKISQLHNEINAMQVELAVLRERTK
jgi:hypothetical protein